MYRDLKLSDRARVIEMAVRSGITDLDTIEEVYNTFAEGGDLENSDSEDRETTWEAGDPVLQAVVPSEALNNLVQVAQYKMGGPIHIKPENRGKFTALKERTGHSASWFKEHGTPSQKKMATFALNARKWKHSDGGLMTKL